MHCVSSPVPGRRPGALAPSWATEGRATGSSIAIMAPAGMICVGDTDGFDRCHYSMLISRSMDNGLSWSWHQWSLGARGDGS
jgi:hypothetical protein